MTNHSSRPWKAVAGAGTAAALAAGFLFGTPAAAAPPGSTAEPLPEGVTVRPDPSYSGEEFQGWGTSLVWFANATGDYPDEVREKLAEMVFGEEGLNLNIARYNIGGGNAPDVQDYLRAGGAVEGWWKAPEGTTREDVDWWDPENPDHWNPDADQTQRWWVDRIKDDITHWEAFSNSPPWFQTVSGYVSGGFNSSADQLKTESIDEFNAYLLGAVERLEDAHGISVDTLDPFNEPNTPYWGTQLGPDGEPTGGRQEGAHMGPELQQKVLRSLAAQLPEADTDAVISAMDETNPGIFATNWNSYPQDVRDVVSQLNVHTYGTGQRTTVRDLAKAADKPLWMSEVGGSWGNGQNFESMASGLGMAGRIADDLRELEPSAWVLWQPVEDYNNMKPGGESAAGANWGSIQLPFDCTSEDTLDSCPIYTNTKYNTIRNYTHYIEPGDRLVKVNDNSSTAAVSDDGATVVHINDTTEARTVNLDLTGFGKISPNATVTPVLSDVNNALTEGEPVAVGRNGVVSLEVPAESVTTFLIDGVSGVAKDAALIQEGHVYRLQGYQSGKSLAPAGDGAQIATTDPANPGQLWTLTPLSDARDNRARFSITTADGSQQLAVVDTAVVLQEAAAAPGPEAQWIRSTTGDGTYTFVNVASGRLLEVGGQATADGSPATTWFPNSGANQRWTVIDETVLGVQDPAVFTLPGAAPELPATVVPEYRDGARGQLRVTWEVPNSNRWAKPGTVKVAGSATDALGNAHKVTAEVTVDTLVSTEPARAKTFTGGTPELPATVTAVASGGAKTSISVTWDAAPDGAFAEAGVVTLTGTAQVGDGTTLPATVRVQVTEPSAANAADDDGASIAATFTEPGYSTAGLRNGDLRDKAWSNWKSGTKNASDTFTATLPAAQTVSGVVVNFYRDGGHLSFAQTVQVQTLNAAGEWVNAGASVTVDPNQQPAPVTEVPVDGVRTDAVRVVLTARPNTHMTVSELQVLTQAPGTSAVSAAESISLDGGALAGFDAGTTEYSVDRKGKLPSVSAVPTDPYATVSVTQADPRTRTATVTITAEDGSSSSIYRVDMGG
ncbi:Ig-like domain-containing protein [Arthrobacter sp. D2-10]